MADEIEDTLEDRLGRIQRRAEGFLELLKDGEEVTIACADGEVHVEESYRSKFERKYPKLFGRMLSIEAQMAPGYFPYFIALGVAGLAILGLQVRWWVGVLGETVCEQLQSWWFYVPAPLALLYLARLGCSRWEKHVYRRNRQALLDLLAADQLDRDVLLVMLRDESDLDSIVYYLKLDTDPVPPTA